MYHVTVHASRIVSCTNHRINKRGIYEDTVGYRIRDIHHASDMLHVITTGFLTGHVSTPARTTMALLIVIRSPMF